MSAAKKDELCVVYNFFVSYVMNSAVIHTKSPNVVMTTWGGTNNAYRILMPTFWKPLSWRTEKRRGG
jgi:hypothetical protein